MWRQRGIKPVFLLLLIAPKQKNFCVTKDRVPLRGSAIRPAPALFSVSKATRSRGNPFLPAAQVRNSFPLVSPWGQNLPSNRALGLTASHTLSVKFPCMCPVHPHMSAGQDFLIVYAGFWAAGRLCNKKFTLRRAKLCYNSCGTVMIVEKNNCAPAVGPCSERNFLCVMVKKLH